MPCHVEKGILHSSIAVDALGGMGAQHHVKTKHILRKGRKTAPGGWIMVDCRDLRYTSADPTAVTFQGASPSPSYLLKAETYLTMAISGVAQAILGHGSSHRMGQPPLCLKIMEIHSQHSMLLMSSFIRMFSSTLRLHTSCLGRKSGLSRRAASLLEMQALSSFRKWMHLDSSSTLCYQRNLEGVQNSIHFGFDCV